MCLQFKFNTSSITVPHSSLNVYVIQSAEKNFTVWSLKGYQGNHSYFGQVSWTLEQKIKVTQKSSKYTIHASFLLNVTVLINYCNSITLKLECVAGVERRGALRGGDSQARSAFPFRCFLTQETFVRYTSLEKPYKFWRKPFHGLESNPGGVVTFILALG